MTQQGCANPALWSFSSLSGCLPNLQDYVALKLTQSGWEEVTGSLDLLLKGVVHDVAGRYERSNSYHNFRHAVDVFQATAYFVNAIQSSPPGISEVEEPKLFSQTQVLALLTAALFHDAGHVGLGNSEMQHHPLSLVYGPISVNERMHATHAHQVLCRLTDDTYFLKLVMQLILATDPILPEPDCTNGDKLALMKRILRAADVANPAHEYDVAESWRILYNRETTPPSCDPPSFTRQADFAATKTVPALEFLLPYNPTVFGPILQQAHDNITRWRNLDGVKEL
jgi:hypothetical protein